MDHVKPTNHFTPITLHDNHVTTLPGSRSVLARLGIHGQLVHTPGHSPDSVSLLLDSGEAFTGDLTHPMFVTNTEADETLATWELLRRLEASTVYPGHGAVREFPDLSEA